MSDGGDGFGEIMSRLIEARPRPIAARDAAGRPRTSFWWWQPATATAVIESAQAVGLALLPPKRFHPFELDTSSLAILFRAAIDAAATHCVCGIGGSATNDGGFGLAKALGWKFEDREGREIVTWTGLGALARIVRPADEWWRRVSSPKSEARPVDWVVAVDVTNPLLGPNGASRIYGPQKGLKPEDMALAEECLGKLAAGVEKDLGLRLVESPGGGAAGGLGFGMQCFVGARLISGFDLFADQAKLRERIRTADIVVTGEGSIDSSTKMGKGVGGVARLCREEKVPCVGVAGVLGREYEQGRGGEEFSFLASIVPKLANRSDSKREPSAWLARVAADVADRITNDPLRVVP